MSIPLNATPGGLFTRLGAILHTLDSANTYRGVTLVVGVNSVRAQFDSSNQEIADGLSAVQQAIQASFPQLTLDLTTRATNAVIAMTDDAYAVSRRTLAVCLPLLIQQMVTDNDSVNANAVSVAVTTGSGNTGTAVCLASVLGPDGKKREYVFDEDLAITCLNDSQSGTVAAGQESWAVRGELAVTDRMSHLWPGGSGASVTITAKTATATANLVSNGDFEAWTVTNVPDDFAITVGTAGSTVFREATNFYAGTHGLKILGNGSELTCLTQIMTGDFAPSKVYAVHCRLKVSAVPAAGVLKLDLHDGSAVLQNAAGDDLSLTFNLTSATTSWASFGGFFQTPAVLPAAIHLRLRLSTALENAKSVYLDELCLIPATEAYRGGPFLAIFAGATASVINDTFTAAVSNDYGGKLQTGCERFFGMRTLGLQIPSNSAGGETISDSLVT